MPSLPFPSIPLPRWTKPRPKSISIQSATTPRKSYILAAENDGFGLPGDDPDPFGVLALERAGLEIREAGTNKRPSSEVFEYRPAPTSPIFSTYARFSMQSVDGVSIRDVRRESRRDSKRSVISMDQGTQTANFDPPPIEVPPQVYSPKRASSRLSSRGQTPNPDTRPWIIDEDEDEHFEEEPDVIIEERGPAVRIIKRVSASPIAVRARLVTIPKRIPPALPMRSPFRAQAPRPVNAELANSASVNGVEDSSSQYTPSPTYSGFDKSSMDSPNPWSEQTSIPDTESMRISGSTSPMEHQVDKNAKERDPGVALEILMNDGHSGTEEKTVASVEGTQHPPMQFVEVFPQSFSGINNSVTIPRDDDEDTERGPTPRSTLASTPSSQLDIQLTGTSTNNLEATLTTLNGLALETEEQEKAESDSEFHSMPSTPLEVAGVGYVGQGELKEDFS